jgi:hypothetical protein
MASTNQERPDYSGRGMRVRLFTNTRRDAELHRGNKDGKDYKATWETDLR